jgi:hypothetical protein
MSTCNLLLLLLLLLPLLLPPPLLTLLPQVCCTLAYVLVGLRPDARVPAERQVGVVCAQPGARGQQLQV